MGVRTHTRAMPDYGSALQFGLSVTPETARIEAISELVQLADITGLDLVAIQDHAYNHTFLDTWTLIAFLAGKTRQIHFMPDVADLTLRPPPMRAISPIPSTTRPSPQHTDMSTQRAHSSARCGKTFRLRRPRA